MAVSSSPADEHKRAAEKLGLRFPVLSDPEGKAIGAYGLVHPDALPFAEFPIARPAVFLLDGSGTIRERFLTENWRVRARPEQLLAMLDRL